MRYRVLDGFGEIAARYDLALIDLWGVVHDGTRPYPQALECLERMQRAGVERLLLSNAPRRADAVMRQIDGIGVPRSAYDGVVSSGEITHRALAEGLPQLAGRRRYRYVGPEKDAHILSELDYLAVAAIDEAEFVLVTGLRHDDTETVADYEAELGAALARGLPLVCANPDLQVMRGPRILHCAGALAARYAERGGQVIQFGKPFAAVYEACLQDRDLPLSRVVALGDSPRTDIAGANAFGIDSVFVTGGLHRDEIGDPIDGHRLERFLGASGVRPTAILPALRWASPSA